MAEQSMVEKVGDAIARLKNRTDNQCTLEDMARAAIEVMQAEIERTYREAQALYPDSSEAIFEEFTVRVCELFDAELKD